MSLVRLRSICSGRAKRASALDAILKSGFDGSNKHTTAEADRVIDHADQRADESEANAVKRHVQSEKKADRRKADLSTQVLALHSTVRQMDTFLRTAGGSAAWRRVCSIPNEVSSGGAPVSACDESGITEDVVSRAEYEAAEKRATEAEAEVARANRDAKDAKERADALTEPPKRRQTRKAKPSPMEMSERNKKLAAKQQQRSAARRVADQTKRNYEL